MSQRWQQLHEKGREGQVLILFALMSFVLIGFLALSVDAGYILKERRNVQAAADSAAIAGGLTMLNGGSLSDIQDAAEDYAAVNGIDLDSATVSININQDQATGTGEVEVEITQDVQRFFIGAVYTGDWEVGARAVAEVTDDTPGNYALMALDPPGMYVNGNITVDVIGGGAMSNGDVARSGGANAFTVDTVIDAVGNINEGNLWDAPGGFNDNRPTVVDPLGAAVPPQEPLVDGVTNCTDGGPPKDCTMTPGLYENLGKITIKKTATLAPGLYYFKGTSIELQNTQSLIQGNGVMLYFDGPANTTYFDPKNGKVELIAPADGVELYNGMPNRMTVWIANCTSFEAQGNGDFYVEGIFYAPCSYVWLHGTPNGETIRGQVIVGELDLRGTSDMIVNYQGFVDTPRHEVYLTQ